MVLREFEVGDLRIMCIDKATPESVANYYLKNKLHFSDSMPIQSDLFFTKSFWNKEIDRYKKELVEFNSLRYILLDNGRVVGHIIFDQIIRGSFQACFLGYGLDVDYQGRGVMMGSLRLVLRYVFEELKLNRVMANYVPHNIRSGVLLRKLGFEREGFARKYLKLNGKWTDHILTSLISDNLDQLNGV